MIRSVGLDHPTDLHKLSVANLILKYELEICESVYQAAFHNYIPHSCGPGIRFLS